MIYGPGEDTILLKEAMTETELSGRSVLDMGTGSGELALFAAKKGAQVVASDIDPEAVEEATKRAEENDLEIKTVRSDMFHSIKSSFDLVLFNPPYLPGQRESNDSLVGGRRGTELTERFLEQAPEHLEQGGEVLTVWSSRSERDLRKREGVDVVKERKLWFERLAVLRARY